MAKYHFNKDTGRTGKCEAKIKCRLGLTESEHFETREEAQAAFEKSQESPVAKSLSKNSIKSSEKSAIKLSGIKIDLSGVSKEDQKTLQEKWNKHYKTLKDVETGLIEEPKYVAPEDLLVESVGEIRSRGTYIQSVSELIENSPSYAYFDEIKDDTDYVVVVSARQGGGNRECYCEDYDGHEDGCLAANNEMIEEHPNYVADYDDDFDSTYNYFVFDNKITKDQVEEFEKNQSAYNEFENLNAQRKLVEDGKAPAWFVNDEEGFRNASRDYGQNARNYKNALRTLEQDKEKNELANKLIDKVKSGKGIDELKLEDLSQFGDFRNRYSSYDIKRLQDAFEDKKKTEKFKKMYAEAEQLEDGSELKEYLLGDRGTGSYNATEKRGRRNVTVKKTYQRGSLLGKELETKQSIERMANDKIKKFLEPLNNFTSSYKKNSDEIKNLEKSRDESRQKVWESGWVYKSPVPKIPEDFLKRDDEDLSW